MLEILRPYFRGEWERYGTSLLLDPAGSRPSVAAWLSDPLALERALCAHERTLDGARVRKAVASDWLLKYFAALLPPVVVLTSFLKYRVAVGLAEISLTLDERGGPLAFVVTRLGAQLPIADTATRYDALVWHHLHPLIEQFVTRSRVQPDILWGNARRTLLTIFERARVLAGSLPALADGLAEDQRTLLDSALWPDGQPNPLFFQHRRILLDPAQTLTLHTSCCLAYQLPRSGHCGPCPLSPVNNKARQLD